MISRLSRGQPSVLESIEQKRHTEIAVCTPEQHQLKSKICGALPVNDINIPRVDVNYPHRRCGPRHF